MALLMALLIALIIACPLLYRILNAHHDQSKRGESLPVSQGFANMRLEVLEREVKGVCVGKDSPLDQTPESSWEVVPGEKFRVHEIVVIEELEEAVQVAL